MFGDNYYLSGISQRPKKSIGICGSPTELWLIVA